MSDKKFCIDCKWCSYNQSKSWWKKIFSEDIEEANCLHPKSNITTYNVVSGAKIEYYTKCTVFRNSPKGLCFHGDLWESKDNV